MSAIDSYGNSANSQEEDNMNQLFPTGAMDGFFAKMKENKEKRAAQKKAAEAFHNELDEILVPLCSKLINGAMTDKGIAELEKEDVKSIESNDDRYNVIETVWYAINDYLEKACPEVNAAAAKIANEKFGYELKEQALNLTYGMCTVSGNCIEVDMDACHVDYSYEPLQAYIYSGEVSIPNTIAILAKGLGRIYASKLGSVQIQTINRPNADWFAFHISWPKGRN